jgi:hypothetical protein
MKEMGLKGAGARENHFCIDIQDGQDRTNFLIPHANLDLSYPAIWLTCYLARIHLRRCEKSHIPFVAFLKSILTVLRHERK